MPMLFSTVKSVVTKPGPRKTDRGELPNVNAAGFENAAVLNRANFNLPGFTLGAADFGVISSARPARTVELGARLSF